jgi:hypothetical protein
MPIAAYEFITAAGRFAISLRPYGRWRVRCANGLLDRSFADPEEALAELAAHWPVPPRLQDWTALPAHTGETMMGGLDPLESLSRN